MNPRSYGKEHLLAIVVMVGAVALAGCGQGSRPTVGEWQPTWTSLVQAIPTQAELGDPADMDLCATTLGLLRERAPDLSPTPDMSADDAVADWLSIAETAFFECPPSSGEITSFAVAYEELRRLESEVNAGLGLGQ